MQRSGRSVPRVCFGYALFIIVLFCFVLLSVSGLREDRDAVRLASVRSAAVDPLRQQTGEGEGGKR